MYFVGSMLTLYYNSILIFDIFLTLHNPFKPYHTRENMYIWMAIFVALYQGTFVILNSLGYMTYGTYGYIQAVTTIIFSGFTGIGLCLTFSRINTQSTSGELKRIVSKRHMLFYIVYMFFIAYALLEYTSQFFTYTFDIRSFLVIRDCLLVTGIPLAIIRITEPFVWIEFKRMVCCNRNLS